MSEFENVEVLDDGEFLGIGRLSRRYRRTRQAVHQWTKRHGPNSDSANPMPRPAVTIRQGNGYSNYGWGIEQLAELDEWVEGNINSGGRKAEVEEE